MSIETDILTSLKDAATDGRTVTVGSLVDFFNGSGETPVTVSQVLAAAKSLVKQGKVKLVGAHSLGILTLAPAKVEAHGVKGMKSTPWRRTFRSVEELNAWCEKNSAEVHGTRTVEE